MALQSELIQLLISFLLSDLFPKQDFPKESPLGRTFEWLIVPYFEGCLILVLWDSINVKPRVITIVISEIFYLNHELTSMDTTRHIDYFLLISVQKTFFLLYSWVNHLGKDVIFLCCYIGSIIRIITQWLILALMDVYLSYTIIS